MNRSEHIAYTMESTTLYSRYERIYREEAISLLNQQYAIENRKTVRVLDFGCGRGELLQLLKKQGYQCEGVDFDRACVESSSKHSPCHRADDSTIAEIFPPKAFDVTVAVHVIEHLADPSVFIRNAVKITRDYLLLVVPNLSDMSSMIFRDTVPYPNRGHRFGWNYQHLRNYLETICELQVVAWGCDAVRLPNVPIIGPVMRKVGMLQLIEETLLPRVVPKMSNSIIALARI